MSLRYLDSFDHYTTASMPARWNWITTVSTPAAIAAGNGRNGTQCLRFPSNTSQVQKTFDAQTGWVIGFALRISATPAATTNLVILGRSQGSQCSLSIDTSRKLNIFRGTSTAVTGGQSTNTLSTGTWYYVELALTPTTSVAANSCYVNVDGVNWATVAAGQSLVGVGGTTGGDSITLQGVVSGNTDIDDLYVCDDQAGVTGPFGNTMVQALYPGADGTTNDWTASTGNRYACVNEATADGDTTYVYCATSGDPSSPYTSQLFQMSHLTYTPAAITGVQWNMYARKSDAGYRFLRRFARSHTGGTTSTGPVDHSVGIDYRSFTEALETDPCSGGAAWTRALVEDFEAGVVLTTFG